MRSPRWRFALLSGSVAAGRATAARRARAARMRAVREGRAARQAQQARAGRSAQRERRARAARPAREERRALRERSARQERRARQEQPAREARGQAARPEPAATAAPVDRSAVGAEQLVRLAGEEDPRPGRAAAARARRAPEAVDRAPAGRPEARVVARRCLPVAARRPRSRTVRPQRRSRTT